MCELTAAVRRYLDGEGSAGERAAIREHLLTCADCAAEQRRHLALAAALQGREEIKAPAGLAAAVIERLAAERRMFGKLDRWIERRPGPELASLALGLSLVFGVALQALQSLAGNPGVIQTIAGLELGLGHVLRTLATPLGQVIP